MCRFKEGARREEVEMVRTEEHSERFYCKMGQKKKAGASKRSFGKVLAGWFFNTRDMTAEEDELKKALSLCPCSATFYLTDHRMLAFQASARGPLVFSIYALSLGWAVQSHDWCQ